MLTHFTAGPTREGRYLAVYMTPGCAVLTVAADCPTLDAARSEADRLNRLQIAREKEIRRGRELRGLRGTYPALKGQ